MVLEMTLTRQVSLKAALIISMEGRPPNTFIVLVPLFPLSDRTGHYQNKTHGIPSQFNTATPVEHYYYTKNIFNNIFSKGLSVVILP